MRGAQEISRRYLASPAKRRDIDCLADIESSIATSYALFMPRAMLQGL